MYDTPATTGVKVRTNGMNRARMIAAGPYFSKNACDSVTWCCLKNRESSFLNSAGPIRRPMKYPVWSPRIAVSATAGASTQMSSVPCAASRPPVNSSDSPGSRGNSRPVSTKTMARIVGSTADANSPWGPIQYIGSRMLGRATTAVLTVFKIPASRIGDYQARPGLGCERTEPVAILMVNRAQRDTCSRGELMPIATPDVYAEMLRRAKEHEYAFPAINCVGSESVNAAIKGFADAGSDGIIPFSTGGAEFASGLGVKDMGTGAVALAEFAHVMGAKSPIHVGLPTDHCPKDKLDTYVRPLLAISAERVAAGQNPLFQSHMWDGSAVPIDENLEIAKELLKLAAAAKIVLEVEIGVVGGEEDGVEAEINDKLYTTPEDFEKTIDALGHGEHGHYLLAATFGNVHGVYKPGNVKLRPDILDQGQKVASAKLGLPEGSKPFDFVFHGGSGSLKSEIEEALGYGGGKMNVDTDAQYAFTRPIAAHMFTNYDGVLKVDGEVGNKKAYDPRSYLKVAEASMTG